MQTNVERAKQLIDEVAKHLDETNFDESPIEKELQEIAQLMTEEEKREIINYISKFEGLNEPPNKA